MRAPYHAEYLRSLAPNARYTQLKDVHHYAFLAPFPEGIAAEVGAPAQDPNGFDRVAFLADHHADVAGFFAKALPQEP